MHIKNRNARARGFNFLRSLTCEVVDNSTPHNRYQKTKKEVARYRSHDGATTQQKHFRVSGSSQTLEHRYHPQKSQKMVCQEEGFLRAPDKALTLRKFLTPICATFW